MIFKPAVVSLIICCLSIACKPKNTATVQSVGDAASAFGLDDFIYEEDADLADSLLDAQIQTALGAPAADLSATALLENCRYEGQTGYEIDVGFVHCVNHMTIPLSDLGGSELLKSLLRKAGVRDTYLNTTTFVFYDDGTTNAFSSRITDAMGGMHPIVALTQKFLSQIQDDGELLGVLSHELGHNIDRSFGDANVDVQKAKIIDICRQKVTATATRAEADAIVHDCKMKILVVLRQEELRADENTANVFGIKKPDFVLDPYVAVQLLARLPDKGGDFSSHPSGAYRAEHLREVMEMQGIAFQNRPQLHTLDVTSKLRQLH